MTPGLVRRVVVADKVETVRRMLEGIASLPLTDLASFTADDRMVAAGESYLRRALEALGAFRVPANGSRIAAGRPAAKRKEEAREKGDMGKGQASLGSLGR